MSADELAAAVEEYGAFPMPVPVGPEPLSAERLAGIAARAEAATAGPWWTDTLAEHDGSESVGIDTKGDIWIVPCQDIDHADAEFMAHAREDVPALVAEVGRQAARIAELERTVRQMVDGLNGHDCPPPDETPMGAVTRFAVRLMEAERLVAELESGQAADGSYLPALPWAALMDDEDLAGFLDELAASAIVHATSEVALAEVEKACSTWRLIAEAQHGHNTAPGPDAVTTSYTASPEAHAQMRAALTRHFAGEPEPEFHTYLHHENRCPHDRPELGGPQ